MPVFYSSNKHARRYSHIQLAIVLLAILLIKIAFLYIDSRPSYFLGDSATYLDTAIFKHIPPDRSFTYGFLLRRIALKLHSLNMAIGVQVFLSAIAAWLISLYLHRFFAVRFWVAAAVSLLCAVEPLQLLMERYIMTESVATFLFALYFGFLLAYARKGNWVVLIAAQAAGVLLLSIRISFLPDVLLNSVLIVLVSAPARKTWRGLSKKKNSVRTSLTGRTWTPVFIHLLISVLVSQGLLIGYKHLYGHLIQAKPALLYANGYFLLADLLPIVQPVDYPLASQREALFTNLKYNPYLLTNRLRERWTPDEICSRLSTWWPNNYRGNDLAATTALNAVKRNPEGLVKLVWMNFASYFDVQLFRQSILDDEGLGQVFPPGFSQELNERFGVQDAKEYQPSITKTWHQRAVYWYWFILCSSALAPLLLLLCRRADWPLVSICVLAALLFFAGATLTVERPNARYLTTAAWLVILMLGVTVDRLVSLTSRIRRAPLSTLAR